MILKSSVPDVLDAQVCEALHYLLVYAVLLCSYYSNMWGTALLMILKSSVPDVRDAQVCEALYNLLVYTVLLMFVLQKHLKHFVTYMILRYLFPEVGGTHVWHNIIYTLPRHCVSALYSPRPSDACHHQVEQSRYQSGQDPHGHTPWQQSGHGRHPAQSHHTLRCWGASSLHRSKILIEAGKDARRDKIRRDGDMGVKDALENCSPWDTRRTTHRPRTQT
jgi:hypothetical protein